jgi:hypothetical protein
MRTILGLAAIALLTAGYPNGASSFAPAYDAGFDYGMPLSPTVKRLSKKIDKLVAHEWLSHREGRDLQRELLQILRLETRYGVDGFAASEQRDVQARYDRFEQRLAQRLQNLAARGHEMR